MIKKHGLAKLTYRALTKFLIIFFVFVSYLLINKTTTYAAAYPIKDTGFFTIYFTDADGTQYGYTINIYFGVGFKDHNVAPGFEGGSEWDGARISYTVTPLQGNDSKRPSIWFSNIGNDWPDGWSGHYRNYTMHFMIPRTQGASNFYCTGYDQTRFGHGFGDVSSATDIANNMYVTYGILTLQEVGILIYGESGSDNDYDMQNTSHLRVYMKTDYDPVTFDLNSTLDGLAYENLGTWGTADVYINGTKVADDTTEYKQKVPYGSTYVVDDIKVKDGYSYAGDNSYSGTIKANKDINLPFNKVQVFDLNSILDGVNYGNLGTWGTADVYINGNKVANDVDDYHNASIPVNSTYSVGDIKPNPGYIYKGPSYYSGIIINDVAIYPPFVTSPTFTITFDAQGGTVSPTSKVIVYSDVYGVLPTPTKPGYVFKVWSTSPILTNWIFGTTWFRGGNWSNPAKYMLTTNQTLYAQWINLYTTVTIKLNGGQAKMYNSSYTTSDITYVGVVDEDTTLFSTPTRSGYTFAGFEITPSEYLYNRIGDSYNYESGNSDDDWFYFNMAASNYTLEAKWINNTDEYPIISGTDSYYTLEDSINGIITETALLKKVTVTDDRDTTFGSSLKVTDYNTDDFKQFTSDGSALIKYQVTDSAGNTSYTTNTVYIVDTTPVVVKENKYVRFISEDYYQKSYEEGGLEANSIWRTNVDYAAVLEKAMVNRRSLVEETGSMNAFGINYSYTKPGSISQDHLYQSWSFSPEDVKKVKAYITTHGLGNLKEPTALSNFLIEFDYCKK